MARSYEEILGLVKKSSDPNRQKAIDTVSSAAQKQIEELENQYNTATRNVREGYADQYEKNAVQKLINEKTIAENMNNIGLTDSGLSKTQQSAVQKSYLSQKDSIDTSKQKALEELSSNFDSSVNSVKNELESNKLSIEQSYDQNNSSTAASIYNSELEAETELEKQKNELAYKIYESQLNASRNRPVYGKGGTANNEYILKADGGLLSRDYYGSLKDNGINTIYNYIAKDVIGTVTYTDNNSGKSTTLSYGVNPYTGEDNINGKSDAAKAAKKYGTFYNGYQPRGVYKDGTYYGKLVKYGNEKTVAEDTYGFSFNIFKTGEDVNTRYWIWDATANNYVEVVNDGQKHWRVK